MSAIARPFLPIAVACLLVAAVGAGYFVMYPILAMKLMCFALFAAAFNLLLGQAGLMSFGHAAFFGSSAYASAHALSVWGWSPEAGLLFGTLAAMALGLCVGFLAIRRQGVYFAMISLAIAQMFYFFCIQAPFTNGEDGIQGVPRGVLFGVVPLDGNAPMYALVSVIFLGSLFFIWRFTHSPFGQVLRAIRDNEARAISLGYSVEYYKLAVFVVSAGLSGLAGATKVLVFQLATLTDVSWLTSGEVVVMTLVGGIGTFLGPLLGAAVVVGLQYVLSAWTIPVPFVLGAIFVLCVLAFPRGIMGSAQHLHSSRLRSSRSRVSTTPQQPVS